MVQDEKLKLEKLKNKLWLEKCKKKLLWKENDLEKIWVLHFYFDQDSTWNLNAHIFKVLDFEWIPTETEEMKPEWFEISKIPYDQMWEDDKIWFPRMLAGETIEYDFYFWNDGKIRDYKLIK